MFKFHFSYKDPGILDKFLRGHNVYLKEDDFIEAIIKFNDECPGCSIEGILKTKED